MLTIFGVLAVAVIIVILVIMDALSPGLLTKLKEKAERRLRKRRLLKNVVFTISDAVWSYAEKINPALIAKWGEGSGKLSYEIFRMRMHIKNDVLPEISKWQDFFDQVLKMKAEHLQKIYDKEGIFRKKDLKNTAPRLLSRGEIDALLHLEKTLVEIKEEAERDFWDLHDTLQCIGLKTWDSYKMYLKLKLMKDFPILNQ